MKNYTLQDLLFGEVEFEYNGEIKNYSFDGISIPLIQRDYAQGRKNEEIIRNRFITSLFNALSKNEILELDFIYGSISKLNNLNYFQPLDGQQRLTTLYLLNWYIANTELHGNAREDVLNNLKRFSYETRTSSTLFCQKICTIHFTGNPKDYIVNSYWFHEEFKSDPTVIAMLEMLGKIHDTYTKLIKTDEKYFNRLSNLKFYVLPLDGFNLSDELYIKMNDRGKQLSHFENFKADFINWMKSEKNREYNKFNESVNFKQKSMPYYLKIASKLDNAWSDYFWEKSIENSSSSEIDSSQLDTYFLKFINNFLLSEFIIKNESKVEDTVSFNFLYSSQSNIYNDWNNYDKLFDFDIVLRLEIFLDKLIEFKDILKRNLAPSWKSDFNWFVDDLEISQINRILFHSIYKYLLNSDFSERRFKEWIRVVWNIIVDPDIRSILVMLNVIRVIDSMSSYSTNILDNLVDNSLDDVINNLKDNFLQNQLIEEKNKAIFILGHENEQEERYNEIVKTEKHELFQGNINFILKEVRNIEDLKHNRTIANSLFSKEGGLNAVENQNHVLFRYVISQFETLDQITAIYYRDDYDYWQLLLRRKEYIVIQNIISSLFSYKDINEVNQHLVFSINKKSSIEDYSHLHNSLYYDNEFHKWFQKSGLDVLWYYSNHLYINRYRSSNDRVLIDNLRNELINKVVTELDFECDANCGETTFYKGKMIDCEKRQDNGVHITIKFYENDFIDVGIWSGHNLQLKDSNKEEDYWIECQEFEYESLDNNEDLNSVYQKIVENIKILNLKTN